MASPRDARRIRDEAQTEAQLPANRKVLHAVRRGSGGRVTVQQPGLEAIERMAAAGHSDTSIARALGIDRHTLTEVRRRDDRVEEALARGRAMLEDELADLLLTQARRGNVVAAIFLAKARCGWREGDAPEARPNITIQLPDSRSEEDYLRIINATPLPLPNSEDGNKT